MGELYEVVEVVEEGKLIETCSFLLTLHSLDSGPSSDTSGMPSKNPSANKVRAASILTRPCVDSNAQTFLPRSQKSKPKNSKRRTVGSEHNRERVKVSHSEESRRVITYIDAHLKVDYLSQLSRELLDKIFSIAAEDSRLASVAPSLKLLRPWERALWRHITIYSNGGTARLLRTLNIYPKKGKLVKRITWEEGEVRTYRNAEWIERCSGRFSNLTEMDFGAGMLSISTLFSLNPHFVELLPNLSICRFSDEQFNSRPTEWLRLVPRLRRVELGWVEQ